MVKTMSWANNFFKEFSINIIYNITKNKQFIAIAVTIHSLKKAIKMRSIYENQTKD